MAHISEAISNLNLPANPPASTPTTQPPSESSEAPSCPDCGGLGFFRQDVPPGHPAFGKPVRCTNPHHTPALLNRMAEMSNLSVGDLARRLNDIDEIHYNAPAKDEKGKMVDNWISNRAMLSAGQQMIVNPAGWLYIWGGPGNAKSEVLIAIVNEVNEAGRGPAMYVTFAHLVNWVREAFRDGADESYIQRFERLKAIKLLAVDEMDKARDTEFSQEFRFHFLDERYRQGILGSTAMVFASNTDPALLPLPLYDRVRDGRFTIVENTAPSARPHMKRGN